MKEPVSRPPRHHSLPAACPGPWRKFSDHLAPPRHGAPMPSCPPFHHGLVRWRTDKDRTIRAFFSCLYNPFYSTSPPPLTVLFRCPSALGLGRYPSTVLDLPTFRAAGLAIYNSRSSSEDLRPSLWIEVPPGTHGSDLAIEMLSQVWDCGVSNMWGCGVRAVHTPVLYSTVVCVKPLNHW